MASLYLLPVELSEAEVTRVLPAWNLEVMRSLRVFIVENVRTARRFLRRCDRTFPIDDCTFYELNGHTPAEAVSGYLDALRRGESIGLMSEAGCPAVADPGAAVVEIAQREGLHVVPLVGPSSILMSLMASGFNGQGFAFNGYLPIRDDEKAKTVKELENRASRLGQTQIFIETPYRNNRLITFLANNLRPDTMLCVAADITDPERESIRTLSAAAWRKEKLEYDKRPTIFLIHRYGK
jgi:16S rRNA (cytidine1402-2'-O)-methyltransferase